MIDRHSVNHHAYPVIHFYTEAKAKNCFSLNVTRLDEALSILINSDEGQKLQEELTPLRSSITEFLQNLEENFSKSMPTVKHSVDSSRFSYEGNVLKNEDLDERRRILERLFRSEGFKWDDVV